jgi:regulatory protein
MDSRPRITAIEERLGDYRVTVSTLPEPLLVPAELVFLNRLTAGVVITTAQLDQLISESERVRCEREITRLLSVREHTAGELQAKLKKKRFDARIVATALDKFASRGLVDDARLAMSLARRTLQKKPSGRSYLVATLRRKMIGRTLAEHVVDDVLAGVDPVDSALRALRQKWPNPDQIDVESIRSKAYSYLSRRGFGFETARAAFTQLFGTAGKVDTD